MKFNNFPDFLFLFFFLFDCVRKLQFWKSYNFHPLTGHHYIPLKLYTYTFHTGIYIMMYIYVITSFFRKILLCMQTLTFFFAIYSHGCGIFIYFRYIHIIIDHRINPQPSRLERTNMLWTEWMMLLNIRLRLCYFYMI